MSTSRVEHDPLLASGPPGLLSTFNAGGVLGLADVHTARALGAMVSESDEAVLLAVALTVRALRLGSVCVDLDTQHLDVFNEFEELVDVSGLPWPEPTTWLAAVQASRLCTDGPDGPGRRPLRVVDGLLYLERYWHQEEQVRLELDQRSARTPPTVDPERLRVTLDRLFDGHGLDAGEPDRQRLAAAVCALRWVTVLAGGPGTGKTTTVARLLALLRDQPGPPLRIALAAPTGKAAARLAEAIRDAADRLDPADAARLGRIEAATVHRLLGWRPRSTRFRHDASNRLPYDVIVVDEMSMVSLTLMARLLEAVRPQARLILVGDPDQLSSVDAGAVLADIAEAPAAGDPGLADRLTTVGVSVSDAERVGRGVVVLQHTWRYGAAIDELARAVRADDDDAAIAVLRSGAPELRFREVDLSVASPAELGDLVDEVQQAGRETWQAAASGDVPGALAGLARHRLLCAHRRGPYGVARWSAEVERWLAAALPGHAEAGEWYPGRPLLVTSNDYELNLFNGDTGVVVDTPTGPRVAFARGRGSIDFSPVRLDAVQTVHAMTVHRAQGSQFGCVSFVVPPEDSPLLTRELFYTAVTRAERVVQVFGTEAAVRMAIRNPANRASGLRDRLGGAPRR